MLKILINIIIIFIFSINLSAIEIKIEKSLDSIYPKTYFDFEDFKSSILMLQPDKLYDSLNYNEKDFVDIFYKIRNNNTEEAISLLEKSYTNYEGITKNLAIDYLTDYYLLIDNYNKKEEVNPTPNIKKTDYKFRPTEIISSLNDTINVKIKSKLILIDVKIGENIYKFLFDTGTDKSIITNSVFKANNLVKVDNIGTVNLNGNKNNTLFRTEIPNIIIGQSQINNSDFLVVEEEDLELNSGFFRNSLKLDGIIGWDIIRNFDYEFQLKENFIIVNPNDKVNISYPFNNLFYLGHPFIQLQISQGYVLNFFFDSGSYESNITDIITQKIQLELVDEVNEKIGLIGGNKEYVTKIYKELELLLYDYNVKFGLIKTNYENNIRFAYYDGIIGVDILTENKVYLSPKKGIFSFIE